jgi:hypothetical protein
MQKHGIEKLPYTLEKKWNNLLNRFNRSDSKTSFPFYNQMTDILWHKLSTKKRALSPNSQKHILGLLNMSSLVRSRSPTPAIPQSPNVVLTPIRDLYHLIEEFKYEHQKKHANISFPLFFLKLREMNRD